MVRKRRYHYLFPSHWDLIVPLVEPVVVPLLPLVEGLRVLASFQVNGHSMELVPLGSDMVVVVVATLSLHHHCEDCCGCLSQDVHERMWCLLFWFVMGTLHALPCLHCFLSSPTENYKDQVSATLVEIKIKNKIKNNNTIFKWRKFLFYFIFTYPCLRGRVKGPLKLPSLSLERIRPKAIVDSERTRVEIGCSRWGGLRKGCECSPCRQEHNPKR